MCTSEYLGLSALSIVLRKSHLITRKSAGRFELNQVLIAQISSFKLNLTKTVFEKGIITSLSSFQQYRADKKKYKLPGQTIRQIHDFVKKKCCA